MNTKLKELHQLLTNFDTGMLVTRTPQGFLTSRPMELQEPRPERALWIVTTENTSSARNIARNSVINLSFRRPKDQSWVSIAGRADLNSDAELIERLWDRSWSAWIPDDMRSQAVLIEIEPYQIDFWEPEHGALGKIFEVAKAAATAAAIVASYR